MKSSEVTRRITSFLLVTGLTVLGATAYAAGPVNAASRVSDDKPEAPRDESTRGELKIEGTHISRLVLRREDGHSEDWSKLSGSINLPVGTYRVGQLTLGDGYTCQSQGLTKLGQIKVTEEEPAVLKAGGPLEQIVDVKRQGRTLVLDYHLRGIGGEEYTAPRQIDNRGAFTVYRGDKAIGAGAFEYG